MTPEIYVPAVMLSLVAMLFGVAKVIDFFVKEKEVKYEIEKTLVVSTAHMSPTDMEHLSDEDHCHFATVSTGYLLVYLGEKGSENDKLKGLENPESFGKIIKTARRLGCTWVKLDQDGPQYEEFDTYDW